MAKVTMPQLGESVAEGTIGRWLKQPGDTVAKYEPLLEVITDKVNAEVPSPFAGVLKEILAEEGATVPNNAEIAVIETDDEARRHRARPREPTPPAASAATRGRRRSAAAEGTSRSSPPRRRSRRTAPPAPTSAPPSAPRRRAAPRPRPPRPTAPAGGDADPNARMTPAVRRLLREHGLEAVADRRHRRRRPDHPRGRARLRRGRPDRARRPPRRRRTPQRAHAGPARAAPAAPTPPPRRPTPASPSRRARTRSSSR